MDRAVHHEISSPLGRTNILNYLTIRPHQTNQEEVTGSHFPNPWIWVRDDHYIVEGGVANIPTRWRGSGA